MAVQSHRGGGSELGEVSTGPGNHPGVKGFGADTSII